jgi:hypothetical protein
MTTHVSVTLPAFTTYLAVVAGDALAHYDLAVIAGHGCFVLACHFAHSPFVFVSSRSLMVPVYANGGAGGMACWP